MSLGFIVSPDQYGGTQVVAITLLQHEDQTSINLGFMQLRLTMNGGGRRQCCAQDYDDRRLRQTYERHSGGALYVTWSRFKCYVCIP